MRLREAAAKAHNKERTSPKVGRPRDADQRISVCSSCRRGIFKFHEHKWTGNGLIHKGCEDG